jgi:hypothetical protein
VTARRGFCPDRCERCGKEMRTCITSMFDLKQICMDCKKHERNHPDYQRAVEADEAAIRGGNYNFAGIGLPDDLARRDGQ